MATAAVFFCPTVFAQSPTREAPFPLLLDGQRWGPFLVEWRFVIDNIGYDDNVFLTADPEQAESDFIIGLGPEIKAQTRFGPNMALTLEDRLAGEIFLRNSGLNHADNKFAAQYDLLLGPVLLTTRGSWDTNRQRPNSEIDDRTRSNTRDLSQSFRLFLSSRIDLLARLGERRYRYTDEDRFVTIDPDGDGVGERVTIGQALDRTEESVRTEIGWRMSRGIRLFVSWSDTDIEFDYKPAGRDARDERTTFGAELSPLASLRGRIEFGTAELRGTNPDFDFLPFDGTVAEISVSYLPTGNTRITARRRSDVRFSTFDRNLFFEETATGLSGESFLGRTWGLQAGWENRELRYPEENTLFSPLGEKRRDDIRDVYAGFVFRLSGDTELGIRFGRRDRDSNSEQFIDKQRYVITTGSYAF
jgi:hypothetical protein